MAAVDPASKMNHTSPSSATYYNQGIALKAQGKLDEAIESYRKALALRPNFVEAYVNLGSALQALGKLDEAIESYRKALVFRPDFAIGHYNLGVALRDAGKLDEAADSFQKTLALRPDFAEAHNNLGNLLYEQGRPGEAVESFQRALALMPDHAEAHFNLGNALYAQGKREAAVESYLRSLAIKPDYAEAHCNLGNISHAQGKQDEAIKSFRKALALKPDFAAAYHKLGNALQEQGKHEEAIQNYRRALSLQPSFAKAHNNMGISLQYQCRLDEAADRFRQALALKPDYAIAYSNLLFLYAYHFIFDPAKYLSMARDWEQACVPEQERKIARNRIFRRQPLVGRRLKVGYVSGDYRQHAVSYFVEQLFARHDRTRIELFAYSSHRHSDVVTERLQALADHWITLVEMPDAAARERIETDGIDVLVDLSGETAFNRKGVFALRAAPVQVQYLGLSTSGLTEMDYFIGDEILTPPETDSHFSEQVWRLPRVWQSYGGKADAPPPDWRPSRDGIVWVGSFTSLNKLIPPTLNLWAKVLHALPEAKLLLKAKELADAGNRRRIMDALSDHGIAPNRIELHDSSITPSWQEHMAYYNRLDIALDPINVMSGTTTTCDALWMGVPVIALEGNRMGSRMTVSLLNGIGHPEWIARSEAEYVDKIVALARDVEQRKALRSAQRKRMADSPLCDARDLAMNLENAYSEMFERWMERENRRLST